MLEVRVVTLAPIHLHLREAQALAIWCSDHLAEIQLLVQRMSEGKVKLDASVTHRAVLCSHCNSILDFVVWIQPVVDIKVERCLCLTCGAQARKGNARVSQHLTLRPLVSANVLEKMIYLVTVVSSQYHGSMPVYRELDFDQMRIERWSGVLPLCSYHDIDCALEHVEASYEDEDVPDDILEARSGPSERYYFVNACAFKIKGRLLHALQAIRARYASADYAEAYTPKELAQAIIIDKLGPPVKNAVGKTLCAVPAKRGSAREGTEDADGGKRSRAKSGSGKASSKKQKSSQSGDTYVYEQRPAHGSVLHIDWASAANLLLYIDPSRDGGKGTPKCPIRQEWVNTEGASGATWLCCPPSKLLSLLEAGERQSVELGKVLTRPQMLGLAAAVPGTKLLEQKHGDVVVTPPGWAHAVVNNRACVKVALDFVTRDKLPHYAYIHAGLQWTLRQARGTVHTADYMGLIRLLSLHIQQEM